MEDCRTKHKCRPPLLNPTLPTRVLDVFASDRTVALLETRGQRGKYVALSHSWGKSPRLMATKATVEDMEDGIAISFLPKTFQDAIQITKRLGIRYLWIGMLVSFLLLLDFVGGRYQRRDCVLFVFMLR